MTKLATEQEEFWAGEFGREYIKRNEGADRIAQVTPMFCDILRSTQNINSVLELGANVGNNLRAIRTLLPEAKLSAVEISRDAYEQLSTIPDIRAERKSIYDISYEGLFDLVFTRGVLIHIPPERLDDVYDICFRASRRYILLCEYYNPQPMELEYRGHRNRMFKRDFAGDMMDRHNLVVVDYGFVWHRDPAFPQDDITWFLMEKPT